MQHVMAMPQECEHQSHILNVAARECYGLRNAAALAGNTAKATDFEALGDIYFGRALALTAEWEA